MIHKFKYILVFLLITYFSYAQTVPIEKGDNSLKLTDDNGSNTKSNKSTDFVKSDSIKKQPSPELIVTPTIGLGTGMFSFYGDLYNKHFQAPMVSRLAFDLSVSQPIQDYLLLSFHVIFGKLGANERFAPNNRNLNFESQIRVGGINLEYNFDNLLPPKRTISPYVSLGFESFEFLSKIDRKDKNGKTYYYWADGTIRDKDEQATDAGLAIEIKRDYTYESDIREMNLDNFGKYPERSFAIPVGAGVVLKINDFFDFKMGATMHFSFTDYIDGVTEKSTGNRKGNSRNDNFMMTSFSLHYNLETKAREKKKATKKLENNYNDVDFAALEKDDYDKDGVIDWNDLCAGTPPGVPVDVNGCPKDDDQDGIPNYRDDELKSPKNAVVNTRGLQLTDSLIAYQYNLYMDSTGDFGLVDNRDPAYNKSKQKEYAVELGTFKKGLPANLMTKFLSINDISSANTGDSSTIYTAGKFTNYEDAEKRRQELIKDGLADAKVVYKLNSKYYDATPASIAVSNDNGSSKDFTGKLVGSDKTPLANSKVNLMSEKGQILQTTTTDETGAFHFTLLKPDQFVLVALDEQDTQLKKFKKVFLVTDKGDKVEEIYPNNIAFNTANNKNIASNIANNNYKANNTSAKNNTNSNNTVTANNQANNKNISSNSPVFTTPGIVLRVQLGAYKKRLSKAVFRDINDLIEIRTDDGLYKYMTGSFTSMEPAAKLKTDMLLSGYPGAFITAYKDGKRITLKEAGATLANKDNITETADNTAVSGVNKKLVKFKVQIGVFKKQPPDNKLAIFAKLKDLNGEKTSSGLTRYVVGLFNSYKEAEDLKNVIIKTYGLTDAFVVATFNNEYISIPEALEILK